MTPVSPPCDPLSGGASRTPSAAPARDGRGLCPTPTQAALHAARKQRLARLTAAAERAITRQAPPPVVEVEAAPLAPVTPGQPPYVAGDPLPCGRALWFRIEAERAAEQGPELRDIQLTVCAYYKVTLTDMLSHRRLAAIVRPRQIAVYLARELTLLSLPQIGAKFGGRDHTTALVSHRKIARLMASDARLATDVTQLRAQLTAPGRVA